MCIRDRYFDNARLELLHAGTAVTKTDNTALKQLNESVNQLLAARRAEINSGDLETSTKRKLVETKSVTDQFNFLRRDASAIYKLACAHDAEMQGAA